MSTLTFVAISMRVEEVEPFQAPKVSVILPAYNAAKYIGASVESILGQSFEDFELLVFNDGSTDGTLEVLNSYRNDSRLKVENYGRNIGLVQVLNRGLELASGKYIARMDADDISRPERFEKQVTFLDNHPEIALCGSWLQYIGSNVIEKYPERHQEILAHCLTDNPFAHPSVMFRRGVLDSLVTKGYRAEAFPAEDFDLWMRILKVSQTANIPEVLLDYRIHVEQISQRNSLQTQKSAELRKSWATWITPWISVLPQRLWQLVDRGLQRDSMRFSEALVCSAVIRGMYFSNYFGKRVPPTYFRKFLRSFDPLEL